MRLLNGAPTFLGLFGTYFVLSFFYWWLAFVFGENLCAANELGSKCLESLERVLRPLALPIEFNSSQMETGGLRIRSHFYSSTQGNSKKPWKLKRKEKNEKNLNPPEGICVIYWPLIELSIKRCTCVNKRKNSWSRWVLENNITRCPGGSSQLETGCQSENQLQTEGFGPLVTPGWANQAKIRKKYCYSWEKNLGQYSSLSLSPLISHTQQTLSFRK